MLASNPQTGRMPGTEAAVATFAIDFPAHGQVRASNELRKQGVFVSPSGVRSVWLRHNLASMKQRLTALEKKSAEEGLLLTEAQVQALERKKYDDEAHGEIETHHPGYLGSQDTFYVGTIKGVGRIYQQTFVDTYSKWAAAKLYTTKTGARCLRRVTLIDASAGTLSGTLDSSTSDGSRIRAGGKHGVTLRYEFDLLADTTAGLLTATVTSVGIDEQTKALSEGFVTGMALATQGADTIAGPGMSEAMGATQGAGMGAPPPFSRALARCPAVPCVSIQAPMWTCAAYPWWRALPGAVTSTFPPASPPVGAFWPWPAVRASCRKRTCFSWPQPDPLHTNFQKRSGRAFAAHREILPWPQSAGKAPGRRRG